jgi:hypothetical protein
MTKLSKRAVLIGGAVLGVGAVGAGAVLLNSGPAVASVATPTVKPARLLSSRAARLCWSGRTMGVRTCASTTMPATCKACSARRPRKAWCGCK